MYDLRVDAADVATLEQIQKECGVGDLDELLHRLAEDYRDQFGPRPQLTEGEQLALIERELGVCAAEHFAARIATR